MTKKYTKIKITKLADVQPGDWVKAEYDGHPFEGEAWGIGHMLALGATNLRYLDRREPYLTFISATRKVPIPTLPTKPGTRFSAVVTRRDTSKRVWLMVTDQHSGRAYVSADSVVGALYHFARHIDASTVTHVSEPEEVE